MRRFRSLSPLLLVAVLAAACVAAAEPAAVQFALERAEDALERGGLEGEPGHGRPERRGDAEGGLVSGGPGGRAGVDERDGEDGEGGAGQHLSDGRHARHQALDGVAGGPDEVGRAGGDGACFMPRVQVDRGAIPYILGGANVMCPGLTGAGADMPSWRWAARPQPAFA